MHSAHCQHCEIDQKDLLISKNPFTVIQHIAKKLNHRKVIAHLAIAEDEGIYNAPFMLYWMGGKLYTYTHKSRSMGRLVTGENPASLSGILDLSHHSSLAFKGSGVVSVCEDKAILHQIWHQLPHNARLMKTKMHGMRGQKAHYLDQIDGIYEHAKTENIDIDQPTEDFIALEFKPSHISIRLSDGLRGCHKTVVFTENRGHWETEFRLP